MQPLTGKTFSITGAGGGIASAINLVFTKPERTSPSLIARRTLNAPETNSEQPSDLSSLAGAQAMLTATLEHCGRVDGLIHTVGGFASGKVLDSSLE